MEDDGQFIEESVENDEIQDAPEDTTQDDPPEDEQPVEEEVEEVEVDGKTYRLPKDVKPYLMRHIDYTQKTMALADERRALETTKTETRAQLEQQQKDLENVVKLRVLDDNISKYEQINWQQLSEQDPVRGQTLLAQYMQLKNAKDNLTNELQIRKRETELNEQREAAKLKADNQAIVQRDIPGWTPERERQVKAFAVSTYGFDANEVEGLFDAKVLKLLNDAYLGKQISKTKPLGTGQGKPIKPVTALKSGSVGAQKNPAQMTPAEYAKWRKSARR